jgi:hypothetical protein
MLAIQKPQASILDTTPIADNVLPRNNTATHIRPINTNVGHQTKYRLAPTKTQSKGVDGVKKRKYASKKT